MFANLIMLSRITTEIYFMSQPIGKIIKFKDTKFFLNLAINYAKIIYVCKIVFRATKRAKL